MSKAAHTVYPPIDRRRAAVQLVGGGLVLALGLSVIGWLIVDVDITRPLIAWEESVNGWFVDHRTPFLNTLTQAGSTLADTFSCIALLIVMVVVTRLWLGRWREPLVLGAAIMGELLVFLIVTAAVQRDRPDVLQLDAAPPTSSFPSGHTAAAVALYGCIAVIVNREMRTKWLALLIAAASWAVPAVVGISRVYRGMHYPVDVIFGYIGGGLWLTIVLVTLLPVARRRVAMERRPLPSATSRTLAPDPALPAHPLGRA
ncbi:MAG: phosphatase PAP2 family protein [Actinomycetota bacterium]|nr:phosphatase PAP2 family protein [Actinomycetota bacterium]